MSSIIGNRLDTFSQVIAKLQNEKEDILTKFPDLRNLDFIPTEFLAYLQKEMLVGIPESNVLDIKEFLTEAKSWYSGKGTKASFTYISELLGVELEVIETSRQIMRTGNPKTVLSGHVVGQDIGPSGGDIVPKTSTRLGMIRDGITWGYFIYIVRVHGAKNVDLKLLQKFLDVVHASGNRRILDFVFEYYVNALPSINAVTKDSVQSLQVDPTSYSQTQAEINVIII